MLDKSIPFYNLILKCVRPPTLDIRMPPGFSLRPYQDGDGSSWAALEYAVGDFDSQDDAHAYFLRTYGRHAEALRRRCVIAISPDGRPAGSCIAWWDRQADAFVPSLHWLAVDPAFQRNGLGRALCLEAMRIFRIAGEYPVYLHTQPWSYAAILLYTELGFRLQKTDTFAGYENQYEQGMQVLRTLLTPQQYDRLAACAE